jgi:hypothetical protein
MAEVRRKYKVLYVYADGNNSNKIVQLVKYDDDPDNTYGLHYLPNAVQVLPNKYELIESPDEVTAKQKGRKRAEELGWLTPMKNFS